MKSTGAMLILVAASAAPALAQSAPARPAQPAANAPKPISRVAFTADIDASFTLDAAQLAPGSRVLDIAAGHGRYVLDAVASSAVKPESIELRDYSDLNVRDGSALIKARGLDQVARFIKGDAFDRASLASTQPAPTVAVV